MTTTTRTRTTPALPAAELPPVAPASARRIFARLVATYPATRGAVMPILPPRGRAQADR